MKYRRRLAILALSLLVGCPGPSEEERRRELEKRVREIEDVSDKYGVDPETLWRAHGGRPDLGDSEE